MKYICEGEEEWRICDKINSFLQYPRGGERRRRGEKFFVKEKKNGGYVKKKKKNGQFKLFGKS
uniref:Uncharacterized protein n=1 Tax=Cucumis melo TaxID=3656 RepID=A0A9I9EGJ4_CUCME